MILDTPATQYDLACCMGRCQMTAWQLAKVQITYGQSWSLRTDDGETVAVAGFWPNENGTAEGWFMTSDLARDHLKLIIKLIRLTLCHSAYPSIDVIVTTKAGGRIAKLCGLSRIDKRDGMEIWRWADYSGAEVRTMER